MAVVAEKAVKDKILTPNRNAGVAQTAPETDVTSKADLYKEMKQVASEQPDKPVDTPLGTPLADSNIDSTLQAPKDTATHDKDGFLKAGSDLSAYEQAGFTPNSNTKFDPSTVRDPVLGNKTAEEMKEYLDWYKYVNMNNTQGWVNGLSTNMNLRSMSNAIGQQMLKNSADWHSADAATKEYLHQQNVELEKLLQEYAGGVKSTYDPVTGQWSTKNAQHGYGTNMGQYRPEDYDIYIDYYGMTPEQIEKYRNDTDRYYNFVDQDTVRNWVDESSGFSGAYGQFDNGNAYIQLLTGGTHNVNPYTYQDVIGDGFMDEWSWKPMRDANGNIIPRPTFQKNNSGMTDYTKQFMSTIKDGIIIPSEHQIAHAAGGPTVGKYNNGMIEDGNIYAGGIVSGGAGGNSSGNGGSQNDYINQMYSEALKAQLAQLESSYKQNISDLDASVGKVDNTYNEQKRQADGLSAQNAASWREMANAYGLNSGAIGQAALAQNNQNQIDINTLSAAQAQAQADIERQRTLLGQQYQLQINQAIAENNFQKAEMLYQEAVRSEEALRQQEQFNASMMQQYAQMAMQQQQYNSDLALQYAKMAGVGSSGGGSGTPKHAEVIMPNIGTDEWYRTIRDQAAASGQDAADYINQNYKTLGLQSGDRDTYYEKYTDWDSNWFNKGAGDAGAARLDAANFIANTGIRNGFDVAAMLMEKGYSDDTAALVLNSLGIK